MSTRALWIAVCGLALAATSYAQPPKTFSAGKNDIRPLYLNNNTGPQRTLLTRENRFPQVGKAEVGAYFEHDEQASFDRDSIGAYGRVGFWENMAFEAGVPFIDSEFNDDSNSGVGDVELKLDLLAFQDIFRYPFVIPHVDVSLPTGDEDKGLGVGETVTAFGISIGTVVYEQLTYVLDVSYAFNARPNQEEENVFYVSGSLVWDISDRFAVLAEGRVFEENDFGDTPYILQGGLAYRLTEDVQIAGYGGQLSEDTGVEDDTYDLASLRLSVLF